MLKDLDPLANRIIDQQRMLLDELSEKAAEIGWTCHYVVMSLDGPDLAADVRLTLDRTAAAGHQEAECAHAAVPTRTATSV